jgi:tetratricopeptide (TPR) repeat protein
MKEKLTGNPEKAADLFAQTLRSDPKNHAAMYELAAIYNDAKKYSDALFFVKSAVDLDPTNEWYQLLLADTYQKMGSNQEAGAIYQRLAKTYPDHPEYLFQLSETYLMQSKFTEAIKIYDQIEEKIGISKELTVQKQRLYLKQGKIDEAAKEIEKLIKSDPQDITNYSMLVELYQANNLNEKALEAIKRMQAIDPENPTVALSLAEYYRSAGNNAESYKELKKAFGSKMLSSDVKIRILSSYIPLVEENKEMMTQALELSKIMSETHPTEGNPQAVYGDFLAINKNSAEARTQYRLALSMDKKNLQAWQQLFLLEAEMNDYVMLEKESNEALELFPDQSVIYLFNGIAKNQNKNYEGAAKTLLSGSKMVVDNDPQLAEFYSNLGDVYNKLKKYEDSDKYYDKALKLEPNNTYVMNNWAYYLSLRKEQLEKAAEMSLKSNELSPNNASFQDTYGWILYEQGKYADAKIWIEKAMQSDGEKNGTILEHYGDIQYKLGNIEEAVKYWQKAKLTGDYTSFLDKKIADKKLYE